MNTVLLAEDSDDDVFAMKMACNRTGIPHSLQVVTDGEMAIDYLAGNGKYADRTFYPLPRVVFLDISMPKRTGHEVLAWVRAQESLKQLPVVMLTGSKLSSDIQRAYTLGVTSYVQKVSGMGEFGQAIRVILKYWLELNVIAPPKTTGHEPLH
jgi:CheY-like chemotaxis protein